MAKSFAGQNLAGANFRNQNLVGANFRGANLQGADFQGANLQGAQFASNRSPISEAGSRSSFRWSRSASPSPTPDPSSPAPATPATPAPATPAAPPALRPGLTDLRGANFQGAQIQGANFARADLTGANFQGAKGGLRRRTALGQWVGLLGLGGILLGLGAVLWVAFGRYFFSEDTIGAVGIVPGLLILGVQVALCNAGFRRAGGDRPLTGLILAMLTGFAALVGMGGGDPVGAVVGALSGALAGVCVAIAAFGVTGLALLQGTIAVFLVLTGAIVLAGMLSLATLGAGVLAVAGAVTGAEVVTLGLLLTLVGLAIFLGLGSWGAWQSHRADRLTPAWQRLLAFATWGGTCFRHSDLTEATFAGASVAACSFDRACTDRTHWRSASGLNQALPNANLAANWPYLDLFTQGRGRGRDLRDASLAGVSLRGANLREANLAGVDLRGSVLAAANLSGANLMASLCQGTDFAGATLTGAKVGQWSVDRETRWQGVVCDYVFLDEAETDRCPAHPRQIFREGDFQNYFQADRANLALLLRQGIHPYALGLALEVLQQQWGLSPRSIVAIEHRDPHVLLRLAIPNAILQTTSSGEIARRFYQAYDLALKPSPQTGVLAPPATPPAMGTLLGHLLTSTDGAVTLAEPSLADRLRQCQTHLQTNLPSEATTPERDRARKYLQILIQWAESLENGPSADGLSPDLHDRAELALDALQGWVSALGDDWEAIAAEVRRSLA